MAKLQRSSSAPLKKKPVPDRSRSELDLCSFAWALYQNVPGQSGCAVARAHAFIGSRAVCQEISQLFETMEAARSYFKALGLSKVTRGIFNRDEGFADYDLIAEIWL